MKPDMLEIQEKTWVFSDSSDPIYQIMHAMEETARLHTISLKLTQPELHARYGVVWMIVRAWMHFHEIPDLSKPLTIRTWHRGLSRSVVYRDFDLIQDGKLIGEAVQSWVLVDSVRRRLFRMDQVEELVHTAKPEVTKALRPAKPIPPDDLMEDSPICAGNEAVDANGHINNASYVTLVLQTLPTPLTHVSTLELCYHRECFAGQQLPRMLRQDEHGAYVRLFTPEGEAAFDCKIIAFQ